MTLYAPFFTVAVDDTERAAILLHEAQHLWGAGEEAALESVWRDKQRLGWTADQYAQTKVWKNTREPRLGSPRYFSVAQTIIPIAFNSNPAPESRPRRAATMITFARREFPRHDVFTGSEVWSPQMTHEAAQLFAARGEREINLKAKR